MAKPVFVSSELILRFLLDDHPVKSKAAREFFEVAQKGGHALTLSPETTRVVWETLGKLLGDAKAAGVVQRFLMSGGVKGQGEAVLQAALEKASAGEKWERAWLAASAGAVQSGWAEFAGEKVEVRK